MAGQDPGVDEAGSNSDTASSIKNGHVEQTSEVFRSETTKQIVYTGRFLLLVLISAAIFIVTYYSDQFVISVLERSFSDVIKDNSSIVVFGLSSGGLLAVIQLLSLLSLRVSLLSTIAVFLLLFVVYLGHMSKGGKKTRAERQEMMKSFRTQVPELLMDAGRGLAFIITATFFALLLTIISAWGLGALFGHEPPDPSKIHEQAIKNFATWIVASGPFIKFSVGLSLALLYMFCVAFLLFKYVIDLLKISFPRVHRFLSRIVKFLLKPFAALKNGFVSLVFRKTVSAGES